MSKKKVLLYFCSDDNYTSDILLNIYSKYSINRQIGFYSHQNQDKSTVNYLRDPPNIALCIILGSLNSKNKFQANTACT